MPYQPHTLVSFGGTLSERTGADEIWQCGVRGFQQGGGQVDAGALDALALAVLRGPTGSGGGIEGIWGRADGHIPADARLTWCKAANINPDGSYAGDPGLAQWGGIGGSATQTLPSFCSVAISWTTGVTLGKAVRGRIYPPNYGVPLLSGSRIGLAADILAWGQALLHAIDHSSSDDGYDFNPYVVSSSGVSRPIAGLRVGDVVDVQRRRKNAVGESYTSGPTTGPSGA